MSCESEAAKFLLLKKIKQLEKKVNKNESKPVTQNIVNQYIIQGNYINNSNLNANVIQHGNSLRSAQINDDFGHLNLEDTGRDAELRAQYAKRGMQKYVKNFINILKKLMKKFI